MGAIKKFFSSILGTSLNILRENSYEFEPASIFQYSVEYRDPHPNKYLSYCENKKLEYEDFVADFAAETPIYTYIRDRNNRRIGVTLAYVDYNDQIRWGYSICHKRERNKFNKWIGLFHAMDMAVHGGHFKILDPFLEVQANRMLDRAKRLYQGCEVVAYKN